MAGATDITPCHVQCEDVPKVWFNLELKQITGVNLEKIKCCRYFVGVILFTRDLNVEYSLAGNGCAGR